MIWVFFLYLAVLLLIGVVDPARDAGDEGVTARRPPGGSVDDRVVVRGDGLQRLADAGLPRPGLQPGRSRDLGRPRLRPGRRAQLGGGGQAAPRARPRSWGR